MWDQYQDRQWDQAGTSTLTTPIPPLAVCTMARLIPCESQRLQTAGNTDLVRLGPFILRLPDAVVQHVGYGYRFEVRSERHQPFTRAVKSRRWGLHPLRDQFIPWITFIAVGLLLLGHAVQLDGIEPPGGARAVTISGFGPQLVALARQFVNPNAGTRDRPEPPAPRLISQIIRMV